MTEPGDAAAAGAEQGTAAPRAPVADGTLRRLDPRQIDAERVAWAVLACVLGAAALLGWGAVFLFGDLGTLPLVLLGALAAAIVLALVAGARYWPPLAWRRTSYRADESGIEIRRGVVWRAVTTVPRARIQHTDVTQGPLQRRFGLAALVLHTAGTENSQVTLEGVSRATALALRDELVSGPDQGDAV